MHLFVPERIDITACLETDKSDIYYTFLLKKCLLMSLSLQRKEFLSFYFWKQLASYDQKDIFIFFDLVVLSI